MKVKKKFLAALSGGAAVLLAVSACGGDDTGKKQDDWAKGVCDQAQVQLNKINTANTSFGKVDSGGKPQDVKSADSAAFQSISDAYKSLAGIFGKAGAAPGDDGAKFQQNAVNVFNQQSAQYAALKKQVDGLDTSDQAKFAAGLGDVSTSLKQTAANGQKSLDTLRQGDMGKALAQQPGCQGVSGGSTSASPTAS
ncbi:small secreted protein [Streptomyces sp. NBC_00669]|uniref:small secreted protein n=1 Tax=unclassified Streptomyces TaxID=2593676 RepID=UPI002E346658|nr:small secreted protein [Streptomyces sp. NBC_00669]